MKKSPSFGFLLILSFWLIFGGTFATQSPGSETVLDELTHSDMFFEAGPQFGAPILDCSTVRQLRGDPCKSGVLSLSFGSQPSRDRSSVDFPLELDASKTGTFFLDVRYQNPEAVSSTICYFQSGNGWFSMSPKIDRKSDWEYRLSFSPSTARIEGNPDGLKKIKAVRFAFYAGKRIDSSVELKVLYARTNDVLILLQDGKAAEESSLFATQFTKLLQQNGLNPGGVQESELSMETLKGHPILILPILSGLKPESVNIISQYMEAGGFVVVCYGAPSKLLEKMGFQQTGYIRCEDKGLKISGIRLNKDFCNRLSGKAPDFIPQNSWNFVVGKPLERSKISDVFLQKSENAPRVVGYWANQGEANAEYPAMLWSGRGLWITHVLMSGEGTAEKRKFLCSLMNQYQPQYLCRALREQWKTLIQIGIAPGDNIEQKRRETAAWALKQLNSQGFPPEKTRQLILEGNVSGDGFALGALFDDLIKDYREQFCRKQTSKSNEKRLIWEHSGMGTYPGDWDATMSELAQAGFTGIVCNLAWGGEARYVSAVLPVSAKVQQYGDQIEQAVKAGKKYGIEVHVWKVDFNCSTSTKEFLDQMRSQGRLQRSQEGQEESWLCPSNPKNKDLEVESFKEIVRKYDVDGIHFDYIRFPNTNFCFCDGCKQRFGQYYHNNTGKKLEGWPTSTYRNEETQQLWRQWRRDQIAEVVQRTHDAVKSIRPEIQVSAAVFSGYPGCAQSVGQDWVQWAKKGWLDFVCPMDYTNSAESFANMVRSQQEALGGCIPMYPGIGIASSSSLLPPDQCVIQINSARSLNAPGWTLFCLNPRTAALHFPFLKIGVTKPQLPPSKAEPK